MMDISDHRNSNDRHFKLSKIKRSEFWVIEIQTIDVSDRRNSNDQCFESSKVKRSTSQIIEILTIDVPYNRRSTPFYNPRHISAPNYFYSRVASNDRLKLIRNDYHRNDAAMGSSAKSRIETKEKEGLDGGVGRWEMGWNGSGGRRSVPLYRPPINTPVPTVSVAVYGVRDGFPVFSQPRKYNCIETVRNCTELVYGRCSFERSTRCVFS